MKREKGDRQNWSRCKRVILLKNAILNRVFEDRDFSCQYSIQELSQIYFSRTVFLNSLRLTHLIIIMYNYV